MSVAALACSLDARPILAGLDLLTHAESHHSDFLLRLVKGDAQKMIHVGAGAAAIAEYS